MIELPKELDYLRRYLTPEGEMVCRPEAARKLLEATNDDSDYIAPEMAKWVFDIGSQKVKPIELTHDYCRPVFTESELIKLMPKTLEFVTQVKGELRYVRYDLLLMNKAKYEQEHGLRLIGDPLNRFYYYASYKNQKKKCHIHEFGPMPNRAELLAKLLIELIEEEEAWIITEGETSRVTGIKSELSDPNGVWEDITGFSFD